MEKKYSLNTRDGEIVSIEVDGVQYNDLDEIPDLEDRAKVEMLMTNTMDDGFGEDFDREFEDEFRQLERQSAKFPALIVGIFALIAVILLAIAVISGGSTARRQAREASTPGQVVDVVMRRYQDTETQEINEYYYPVVEFSLPNGRLRTVQLSEGSWPAAYAKGDAVTVLYDPQQPNSARIQSASSTLLAWIGPGITGVVGLAFLAAAIFAWWFLKPEPVQAEAASSANSG
jgi:hypothetical protein